MSQININTSQQCKNINIDENWTHKGLIVFYGKQRNDPNSGVYP